MEINNCNSTTDGGRRLGVHASLNIFLLCLFFLSLYSLGCSEDSCSCDDDSETDTGDTESDTVLDTDSETTSDSDTATDSQSDTGSFCEGDGVLLDTNTGLCWENTSDLQYSTYLGAEAYCENLVLNDIIDWRMPKIQELISLTWGCVNGEQVNGVSECGVHDPDCLGVGCSNGEDCDSCPDLDGPAEGGCYWNLSLLGNCAARHWSKSHWDANPEANAVWFIQYDTTYTGCIPKYPNGAYIRCVSVGHN